MLLMLSSATYLEDEKTWVAEEILFGTVILDVRKFW